MSEIQSITFDINNWNSSKALQWLKKNKFRPIKRVDKTEKLLRYRLQDPNKFKRFRTKKIKDGISFVFGFNSNKAGSIKKSY